jgi:hypothetical protein
MRVLFAIIISITTSTALAQEAAPAISVSDTREINASQIGLITPDQAGFSDALWKDISATEYTALLHGVARGIPSASIRNLATRALVSNATLPDSKEDLLSERVDALLRLGQASYAQKLLVEIPKPSRKSSTLEKLFLFNVISGASDASICKTASSHLGKKASPLWQRWVVLCQAKTGETDKAQLGLDLLSEQNEYSEFYHKVAQGLITKKPATTLPEAVYLEQAAWLIFAGQSDYLKKQKQPPLALVALMPDVWPEMAKRYGLPQATLGVPAEQSYAPDESYLTLPEKNATDADYRIAFLAYGLRKALGKPTTQAQDAALQTASFRAEQIVTSPSWRVALSSAANAGKSGEVILLLAGIFTAPLNDYAPSDIVTAVSALRKCGLTADADALAGEALAAALAK